MPKNNLKVSHNVPTEAGKSLRWIQTVTANNDWSRDCGGTRVDPFGYGTPSLHKFAAPGAPLYLCKGDDLQPFYWTNSEFAREHGIFSDKPGTRAPAKGRFWTQFVLALTEVTGKNVHHLTSVYSGYDKLYPSYNYT